MKVFVISLLFCYLVLVHSQQKKLIKQVRQANVPETLFSCEGRLSGYYADVETGCQIYHFCDGRDRQYSYTCPNNTLFQQRMLICAFSYMVDCQRSEQDFSANLLIGQRDMPFVGNGAINIQNRQPVKTAVKNFQDSVPSPISTSPLRVLNLVVTAKPQYQTTEVYNSVYQQPYTPVYQRQEEYVGVTTAKQQSQFQPELERQVQKKEQVSSQYTQVQQKQEQQLQSQYQQVQQDQQVSQYTQIQSQSPQVQRELQVESQDPQVQQDQQVSRYTQVQSQSPQVQRELQVESQDPQVSSQYQPGKQEQQVQSQYPQVRQEPQVQSQYPQVQNSHQNKPTQQQRTPKSDDELSRPINYIRLTYNDTRRWFFIPSDNSTNPADDTNYVKEFIVPVGNNLVETPSMQFRDSTRSLIASRHRDCFSYCHPLFVVPGTCHPCIMIK